MKPGLLTLCLLATACLSLSATAGPSMKRKAWITIGDAAFRQIQSIAPDIVPIDSRQLGVAGAPEMVHAIALDEDRLAVITGLIHQRMGQCGGFMYHSSEAGARAALAPRRMPSSQRAYTITRRDLLEPMLANMQEKNIESTILALSGFTNRYYLSQTDVAASDWLLATWRDMSTGRDDIAVAQVAHKVYLQRSVTLTLAGTDPTAETVVVGAHLDSIIHTARDTLANAGGQTAHALKFARLAAAYMVELSSEATKP